MPRMGSGTTTPETTTFFTIGNLGEEMEGSFLDTIMEKDEPESIEMLHRKSTHLELNLADSPRAI
jgi:hypothetical protein